jgi:transposase-like protein
MLCPYCSFKQHHRYGWYTYKCHVQRYKCLRCGKVFTEKTHPDLPRYRHSLETISLATKCYLHYGLSSRKVTELLADLEELSLSHTTIANWARLFEKQAEKFQRGISLPISGIWHLDETFVRIAGRWHYAFAILSEWRRVLVTFHVQPRRTRNAAIRVLKQVKQRIPANPGTIVTDGLTSYIRAVPRVYPQAHHQRNVKFRDDPSNNMIERFFSTFKPRYHGLRGFKTLPRAQAFLDAWGFYYNFLRPHKSVWNNPPAGDYWGNTLRDWGAVLKYRP